MKRIPSKNRKAVPARESVSLDTVANPLSVRDRAITRCVGECFAAYPRLRDNGVTAVVRGGVAHVRGTVDSESDRALLRTLLARSRGVHAVWDIVRVRGEGAPSVIDIGCGQNKELPWAIGVDRHPYEGVDVVADLEKGLPFRDGEIDHVFAVHVLEHVGNLVGLMNEIHRVLRPSGVLHVLSPNTTSVNAVADPTHVRFFNRQTFKYFCREKPGIAPFSPVCVSSDDWNVYADLCPVKKGAAVSAEEELSYFFD